MAFGRIDRPGAQAPIGEINMVPLIDVMLVLLVIFLVTAPLLTHTVKLELPRTSAQVNQTPAEKIEFAIDAQGQRFWNGERIDRAAAAQRFAEQAKHEPQPEVHLRADKSVRYEAVAETLADASKAGLAKIGFVSEPEAQQR